MGPAGIQNICVEYLLILWPHGPKTVVRLLAHWCAICLNMNGRGNLTKEDFTSPDQSISVAGDVLRQRYLTTPRYGACMLSGEIHN
jgi:hypothetical protein